jgi:protein-disulfide isomerase
MDIDAKNARMATIIGVITTIIVVALVIIAGLSIWHAQKSKEAEGVNAKDAFSKVTTKPTYASKDGALVFDKEGIVKNPDNLKTSVPKVDIYIDFNCPGCSSTEQSLGTTYNTMLSKGQIILRVHPIAFLNSMSTDNYSTRAAEAAWRLSDLEPDAFLSYVSYVFSANVFPGEGPSYKPVSDAKIRSFARTVGIGKTNASKITDGKYADYVSKLTAWTTTRKELYKAGSSSFATPIVLVNGSSIDFSQDNLADALESKVKAAD